MANEIMREVSSTALIYHPFYLKHATPPGHPEQPERLSVAHKLLEARGFLAKLRTLSPVEVHEDIICRVHDSQYVDVAKEVAESGGGYIDADTYISPCSYRAAKLAVGGVLAGIDDLFNGQSVHAFCLVRPPGHHAVAEVGMGFCIFNNLAIGARYALDKYKISRVLILDWDAHHGNGIHEIFYENPQVLYISLHQTPLFPGTGKLEEVGEGNGEGYTVNIPLPPGSGDEIYLEAFERIIAPLITQFEPELIMVAAGYDGHFADPLASLRITTLGYAQMTKKILSLSTYSEEKVIFSLEGGYDLKALSYSILATINELTGIEEEITDPYGCPEAGLQGLGGKQVLDLAIQRLSEYWDL